jgi:hypothetical protein
MKTNQDFFMRIAQQNMGMASIIHPLTAPRFAPGPVMLDDLSREIMAEFYPGAFPDSKIHETSQLSPGKENKEIEAKDIDSSIQDTPMTSPLNANPIPSAPITPSPGPLKIEQQEHRLLQDIEETHTARPPSPSPGEGEKETGVEPSALSQTIHPGQEKISADSTRKESSKRIKFPQPVTVPGKKASSPTGFVQTKIDNNAAALVKDGVPGQEQPEHAVTDTTAMHSVPEEPMEFLEKLTAPGEVKTIASSVQDTPKATPANASSISSSTTTTPSEAIEKGSQALQFLKGDKPPQATELQFLTPGANDRDVPPGSPSKKLHPGQEEMAKLPGDNTNAVSKTKTLSSEPTNAARTVKNDDQLLTNRKKSKKAVKSSQPTLEPDKDISSQTGVIKAKAVKYSQPDTTPGKKISSQTEVLQAKMDSSTTTADKYIIPQQEKTGQPVTDTTIKQPLPGKQNEQVEQLTVPLPSPNPQQSSPQTSPTKPIERGLKPDHRRRNEDSSTSPTVRVNIRRIKIEAEETPAPSRKFKRPTPSLSLQDYLNREHHTGGHYE